MALTYAVLGSGAMGLRFGLLLKEHLGAQVDFIDTWEEQIDTVRKQGGVYQSRDGKNRHLIPISIQTPEEYQGKPDVFIIFDKQMHLSQLLERSKHFFHENQYVFTGMNGMGHIEKINRYFVPEKVLAGTCLIGTVLKDAGDVDFIGKAGAGSINIAAQSGTVDDVQKQIITEFEASNLNPNLTDNFLGTLYTKVVFNSVINTISKRVQMVLMTELSHTNFKKGANGIVFNSVINTICTLFEIRMGQFIDYEGAEKLGRQLIDEAYNVAELAGITPLNSRDEEWETIRYVSAETSPLHYPSMYQDMNKGRQTEVDYINGYIYDLGRTYNYQAKTHDFLRHLVHLAENTRKFR